MSAEDWREAAEKPRPAPNRDPDAHCRRKGCPCTHSDGCFRGWIDGPTSTTPCPVCRPQVHDRVHSGIPAEHFEYDKGKRR